MIKPHRLDLMDLLVCPIQQPLPLRIKKKKKKKKTNATHDIK